MARKEVIFEQGDRVKLEGTVVAVNGQEVVVQVNINCSMKDLRKFDDPQETTPMVD